jgi:ABC-2 type transport system ATP-binding protein
MNSEKESVFMASEFILETRNLKKYFGAVHAVEDVSLSVKQGEVFGFLGPNGAGKTTSISVILSLLHATSGEVRVLGEPVTPTSNKVLGRVGALVGAPALAPYLTARQNLELLARLHPQVKPARIEYVLEMVNLKEAANRKAGSFSTGMKQRLGLAVALLHQPELLILDEPTNGMDPAGMREVRQLLRDLAAQGTTVFLSSHLLFEIEQVCDRVAVLNKGRVVASGEVQNLIGGKGQVKVRVASLPQAAEVLARLEGVTEVKPNGTYLYISGVESTKIVTHLVAHNLVPSEVILVKNDLETLFLELTGAGEPYQAA